MNKLNNAFTVSKTFDEVTPESAEQGCTSADGFIYEPKGMDEADLIREINTLGYYELSDSNAINTGHISLYSIEPEIDLATATEYREAIHIETHPALLAQLFSKLNSQFRK